MVYRVKIEVRGSFKTRYGVTYIAMVEGPSGPSFVDPTTIIVYGFTVSLYRIDSTEIRNLLLVAGEVFDLILLRTIQPWEVDLYVREELKRRRKET